MPVATVTPGPHRGDLARSRRLLRAFRDEQSDPARAYAVLAEDAVALLATYGDLRGATVIDVGGGPGYIAEALRSAGAFALTVDADPEELRLHGRRPVGAVLGDGLALPFADASVDLCCTFNALEHVPEPWAFLDEQVRVVRPGGLVFVGVTNWLSPWGGHETSPWHYLGGHRAARRYEARHGRPPKNRYGTSLFPVGIGATLRWARRHPAVDVVDAFPRYYPSWCRPVVRVPGLREVATWNLGLVLERR